MDETRQRRWQAIAAGVLLLLLATLIDRAHQLRLSAVGLVQPEIESHVALKRGVVAALHSKAPRLGENLSSRIADSVLRCGREQALAPDLVLAVLVQESSGRLGARSNAGAIGLMQVMPHMYDELALPGNSAHLETNIEAGCRLLADNIRRRGERRGVSEYFWGNTRGNDRYVDRVQALRREIRPFLELAVAPVSG